jgi:hypothetical protein
VDRRFCIRCNTAFTPSRVDQVYCCRSCAKHGPKGGRKTKKTGEIIQPKKETDESRLKRILTKRGITKSEYLLIAEGHNGCCEICGKPSHEERYKKLSLDHCHETGRPRGFLCANCNLGLGMFKDKTEFLLNAIKYLTEK